MTQKSFWITSKQLEKTNKQTLPIITLKTKKNTHLTIWCRFEVWRHAHLSKLLSISNT
jgi:abortive infection bacteriophage resistance protein